MLVKFWKCKPEKMYLDSTALRTVLSRQGGIGFFQFFDISDTVRPNIILTTD